MEEEFDNVDQVLSTLESPEGRMTYVLSVLKERNEITEDEHNYLTKGILQKDPTFLILVTICKDKTKFEDISSILKAQLEVIRPQNIEHAEDYSPNTQHKFEEVLNDTSPLGEMLMYRKHVAEQKKPNEGFSLNINHN